MMASNLPIRSAAIRSLRLRPVSNAPPAFFRNNSTIDVPPERSYVISRPNMTRVLSKDVMPPVGPYSQAVKSKLGIHVSGQLPANVDGTLVEGTMGTKTAACMKAISSILEEAGSSLNQIVKAQIFLTDMNDFAEMNTEYEKWIKHRPARSCIAIKALPKGASIEIECVALP